jgi:hypothetical protein
VLFFISAKNGIVRPSVVTVCLGFWVMGFILFILGLSILGFGHGFAGFGIGRGL